MEDAHRGRDCRDLGPSDPQMTTFQAEEMIPNPMMMTWTMIIDYPKYPDLSRLSLHLVLVWPCLDLFWNVSEPTESITRCRVRRVVVLQC